ncbi:MSMEG_1061 family FMN-dependent PPOX-type flavoprotein [Palleronia sp.]|uniref:MSMEG_1061 family FMN-dependent PPOX-type flavoprotein n=1 Tax=Palleronia sp. TaxID=1940284 RepID=UPI0035C7B88E
MSRIDSIGALRALYGTPVPASLSKVAPRLTQAYADWIAQSRFCLIATSGPAGPDVSPRGDEGPVVRIVSATRLEMPDWHGNNRVDTLENIVADGGVSLLFMVPGSDNVVRVNGRAHVTVDADLCNSFARLGKAPRSVVVIEIAEVYFQCARAVMRARLWGQDESADLPTAGEMMRSAGAEDFDAARYDAEWHRRARDTM